MNGPSVFERYPQLEHLRGKVPEEVVEREVTLKAERFEECRRLAKDVIPTVSLCDVFPAELERGRVTLENFLGQWGNISIEEVCKLALIIRWLSPRRILEFGTYNGMTTLQMAINSPPDCRIFTIDLPPGGVAAELDVGEVDGYLARKEGFFRLEVGHYFKGTIYAGKITQLLGDSTTIDLAPVGRPEFVFVDAGHTYRYVKSDSERALNLVVGGGVVVWHDYVQVLHPDVTQFLYELTRSGLTIHHLRGTNLAVHYAN